VLPSARWKTPSVHGNFTRENREVSSTPDTQLCAGRLEKDMIQKSNMHVRSEKLAKWCGANSNAAGSNSRNLPAPLGRSVLLVGVANKP
jgi:hypothetical protein